MNSMTKYKLHITFNFEDEDQASAIQHAISILAGISPSIDGTNDPDVALNRDGDRSSANILAPIPNSNNHYKHGKISLPEASTLHNNIHKMAWDAINKEKNQ